MSVQADEIKRKWRARITGRPNISPPPRERNGRHQRDPSDETEKQRKATVLNQPHRRNIKVRSNEADGSRGPGDERAAYAFGRMRLAGDLSKPQHDALAHWLETYARFSKSIGLPQVRFGNCLAGNVGGASFDGEEPDPKAAASRATKARRAFEEIEAALHEGLGADLTEANVALVHVVLMDRDPTRGMTGILRMAGNVIDRHRSARGHAGVD